MSKKLPFEEAFKQQMDHIQSPFEDESWQKMQALLEENDKRKTSAILKKIKAAFILLLLLLAGLWLFIIPKDSVKEKRITTITKNNSSQRESLTDSSIKSSASANVNQTAIIFKKLRRPNSSTSNYTQRSAYKLLAKIESKKTRLANEESLKIVHVSRVGKLNKPAKNAVLTNNDVSLKTPDSLTKLYLGITRAKLSPAFNGVGEALVQNEKNKPKAFDSSVINQNDNAANKKEIEIESTSIIKTPVIRRKKYNLSAGIGLQQQIGLGGQKAVAYGYNGSKGILSDYIPSLYLRFEREQQWFLQAEFIYSTPQLVKNFSYSQQTSVDSPGTVTTNKLRLKKTFYHQFPVSFNYYLKKNWSAGVGITYNSFHGAIAEKEVMTNNTVSQTKSLVKELVAINHYSDSFFYKSHTNLLLQTNYNWRRFSVGLRYEQNLQPYIKYTLPNGAIVDRRSWALEFVVRFRLWKTVKF